MRLPDRSCHQQGRVLATADDLRVGDQISTIAGAMHVATIVPNVNGKALITLEVSYSAEAGETFIVNIYDTDDPRLAGGSTEQETAPDGVPCPVS